MKQCSKCGRILDDSASFCPECGTPFSASGSAYGPAVDPSKVDMYMCIHSKDLPEDKLPVIREALLKMSSEKFSQINMLQFKGTTLMLVISIFIGSWGIDRMMLDDTALGVIKLLTCGGCGIWTIIDWFFITKMTREYNFNKLKYLL